MRPLLLQGLQPGTVLVVFFNYLFALLLAPTMHGVNAFLPRLHTKSSRSWLLQQRPSHDGVKISVRTTTRTTSIILKDRTSQEEYDALRDDDDDDDDEDEEPTPPGQMRVSEIKAELDLRGITYTDCFDKESLADRLIAARLTGQANPEILDKFNRQSLEETFNEKAKVELSDEDIQAAVANDGTLPGGLTPEQFKKLTGNPEVMTLLQSTKVQEAMKLMMTGGRGELEQKLRDDPELQDTIAKLNSIMGGL